MSDQQTQVHGLPGSSIVYTPSGYVTLKDLQPDQEVSDGALGEPFNKVLQMREIESYELVAIHLSDGFVMKVSGDLPLLRPDGQFTPAFELVEGNQLVAPIFPIMGTHTMETSEVLAKSIARGLILRMGNDDSYTYKIIVKDTSESEVQSLLTPEMEGFLGSLLEEKGSQMLTKLLPFFLKNLDGSSALELIQKTYEQAHEGNLIFSDYEDALVVRATMYALGLTPIWTDFGSFAVSLKDLNPKSETKPLTVKSVTLSKPEPLISITVDKVSRYVVNGVVVHNAQYQNELIAEQRTELLKESMPLWTYAITNLGIQQTGIEGVAKVMTGMGMKDVVGIRHHPGPLVELRTKRGNIIFLPQDYKLLVEVDGMPVPIAIPDIRVGDKLFMSLNQFDSKQHLDKSVLVEESAHHKKFPPYVMMLTNPIKWIYMKHWFVNHGRVSDEGLVIFPPDHIRRVHLINFLASLGVSTSQIDDNVLLVDAEFDIHAAETSKIPLIYKTNLQELPPRVSNPVRVPDSTYYDKKVVVYDELFSAHPHNLFTFKEYIVDSPTIVLNSLIVCPEAPQSLGNDQ